MRKVLFFWSTSFLLAFSVYWLLYLFMGHHVYGSWYRMFTYHYRHPVQYMLIPCFFFGLFASRYSGRFAGTKSVLKRVGITAWIIFLTVLVSSPFGGMLWEIHDMLAGTFPPFAVNKVIVQGTVWGLEFGWLVVLLSIPYNIIGSVLCYFLLKAAAKRFENARS